MESPPPFKPVIFRVIDDALVPRRPFRPNLKRSLTEWIGLCGGLLFGVLFVLIRERVNETFLGSWRCGRLPTGQ